MIRILFSFKTLTIFSLNDWTKRQFRNLDKDSDSKSCPHFRFKIFVRGAVKNVLADFVSFQEVWEAKVSLLHLFGQLKDTHQRLDQPALADHAEHHL